MAGLMALVAVVLLATFSVTASLTVSARYLRLSPPWLTGSVAFFPRPNLLQVVAHRPSPLTWQRTQCGGPSGSADIPTAWGRDVSPSSQPLPEVCKNKQLTKEKVLLPGLFLFFSLSLSFVSFQAFLNALLLKFFDIIFQLLLSLL
jgi:hypothetical protein